MNDELPSGSCRNEQVDNLLALNLVIGDALQLQDTSAANLRYYVKLIGFLNKAGIIVSHPVVSHPPKDEALLPVDGGKSFLVRGFSGRKTYVFNANVLTSSATPYPHLHFTFPKKVECMTMPGALRIKLKPLAGLIEPAGADSDSSRVPITIVDISTSGVRVYAETQFGNIGDEIRVMFSLPIDDEEQDFSIPAVIRKFYSGTLSGDAGSTEVTMHGLEFIHPEGCVRTALQSFIYKTMAQG